MIAEITLKLRLKIKFFREQGIESRAKADFKDAQWLLSSGFERAVHAHVDEDMYRLGMRPLHRMVVFVEFGNVEGGTAVVGGSNDSFHSFVFIWEDTEVPPIYTL